MTIPITAFTAVSDSWFHDTLLNVAAGTAPNAYKKRNPSDRIILNTSDTSLAVEGICFDIPQNLSIYVNGVFNQTLAYSSYSTKATLTATLPAGAKVVELEEEGISITGIGSSGCNIQLVDYYAPSRRVINYGDSIEVGYNVTGRFGLGWWQLARRAEQPTFDLLNDSYAGACLWDDNRNSSYQDAWVASLAPVIDGTAKTVLIIDRMTNDYGTAGTWSAANYGAGLLSTLTKLHAAYPTLQVYLKTAILRGTGTFPPEGATNTFGDTLAQYRTAGASAIAAANTALGTSFGVLDGTAMGLLSLTSDGLHPNNVGHAALASWAVANWFPLFSPGPLAPSALVLSLASTTSVNVAWTDNATTETGYYVYYSSTGIKPGSPQVSLPAGSTSTTVSGLTSGLTYTFWVEAYSGAGSSASITGSILVAVIPPVPKVQMQGRNTVTQALVTWVADTPDWAGAFSPAPVADVVLYTRTRSIS